jgi:hypothetical protein
MLIRINDLNLEATVRLDSDKKKKKLGYLAIDGVLTEF